LSKEYPGLASKGNLIRHFWWFLPGVVLLVLIFYISRYPTDRDTLKVLYHAGPNALELLKTLDHFRRDSDSRKDIAAKFLIRNMDLHYYREDSLASLKFYWASQHPNLTVDKIKEL